MVYAQPGVRPRKWDAENSSGFEILTDHLISQTTIPSDKQQQKKRKEKREPAE